MAKKEETSGYVQKVVQLSEVWADWKRNPRGAGVLPSADDSASFSLLKNSIRQIGAVLEPILVVEEKDPSKTDEGKPSPGLYRVVAGYRRFEALIELDNAAPEGDNRWTTVPVVVRPKNFGVSSFKATTNPDGTTSEEESVRTVSEATAESLTAAAENGIRQDVSAWDKITLTGKLARDGFDVAEIGATLSENGSPLSASTIRNYVKIASLPAKVQAPLRKVGPLGYRIAMMVISQEFNQGTPAAPKWKADLQLIKVQEELDKAKKDADEKEKGGKKKGPKKPRFVMKPADLAGKWSKIKKVGSSELIATLGYLLGKISRSELVEATDEAWAQAFVGDDTEEPAVEIEE